MDYKSDSTQNYGLYNILLRETLHRIMDYTSFCQEMFYTRLWIIQHFVKKDFTQDYGLYTILLREILHRIMDNTAFC